MFKLQRLESTINTYILGILLKRLYKHMQFKVNNNTNSYYKLTT